MAVSYIINAPFVFNTFWLLLFSLSSLLAFETSLVIIIATLSGLLLDLTPQSLSKTSIYYKYLLLFCDMMALCKIFLSKIPDELELQHRLGLKMIKLITNR